MKKLVDLLVTTDLQFPVIGKDGYGGEQDGNNAVFVGVVTLLSRATTPDIDVPDWLDAHFCRRIRDVSGCPDRWELSLAYWPERRRDEEIPVALLDLLH